MIPSRGLEAPCDALHENTDWSRRCQPGSARLHYEHPVVVQCGGSSRMVRTACMGRSMVWLQQQQQASDSSDAPVRVRCTGGQGLSPYEQNTQQSFPFGRRIVLQPGHSQKNWHASTGISASVARPQAGHVICEVVRTVSMVSFCSAGFGFPITLALPQPEAERR